MAKRSVNKSQRIRDYKAANPQASAREVQEALASEGIKVSTVLIYTVLGKEKGAKGGKGRRGRRGRKAAAPTTSAASGGSDKEAISIASLLQAKKFAAQMGSIEDAKKAIDALARLA